MPKRLQTVRTTSTASKIFGIRQNAPYANTTESTANLSCCSCKNANSGLTSAHHPGSLKRCGSGVEFRANLVQPLIKSCWCRAWLSIAYSFKSNIQPTTTGGIKATMSLATISCSQPAKACTATFLLYRVKLYCCESCSYKAAVAQPSAMWIFPSLPARTGRRNTAQ